MFKKVLSMFAIVFVLTITAGFAAYASPSIVDVRPDTNIVIRGIPVSFTVYVSAETNFVWAQAGANAVPVPGREIVTAGAPRDAAGVRVFVIDEVMPVATGNVYILAHSINDPAAAAVVRRSVFITVSGGQVGHPGAIAGIQIIDVFESRALQPNAVQLTVITGPHTGEVWVRLGAYPHSWYRGRLQSETPTSRIWTINYIPAVYEPHSVQVGSNTTYSLIGASLRYHDVRLEAPYIPRVNPIIHNRTINTNTVNVGNSTTIRVMTNQYVYSVWVSDADGIETVARRIPPFVESAARHFEVMVAPYRTGTLTIFAGAWVGDPNAVSIPENIVVHVPHVYITQASVTQIPNSLHEEALIRVTTNQNAGSVWAVLPDGETIRLNLIGQPGATGPRIWESRPAGISTPNITIRVSATTSNIPSVTQTLSNWGTVVGGAHLQGHSGIINLTQHNARRGSSVVVQFNVPDYMTQVRFAAHPGIPSTDARRLAQATGGRQLWGETIRMPTDANVAIVTLTVSAYINHAQQDITHFEIFLTD